MNECAHKKMALNTTWDDESFEEEKVEEKEPKPDLSQFVNGKFIYTIIKYSFANVVTASGKTIITSAKYCPTHSSTLATSHG